MPRQSVRRGLTLVELLVVIAIIGVLVALLLPAVQAAREAARKAQCKNNLKQLALAAITHEEQIGWFPTGGWGGEWVGDRDRGFGEQQPGGWAFNVLPFLEEQALYDLAGDGIPSAVTRPQREGAKRVIESPISIINCPSRRAAIAYPSYHSPDPGGWAFNASPFQVAGRMDYAINHGPGTGGRHLDASSASWSWSTIGLPNTFGVDANDDRGWVGISFPRSEVGVRHVLDGTSNTYLIGERPLYLIDDGRASNRCDFETWCSGYSESVSRGATRPPGHDGDSGSSCDAFGSAHHAGFHMAYCDGSVRVVDYDIDLPVHKAAANRLDGGR